MRMTVMATTVAALTFALGAGSASAGVVTVAGTAGPWDTGLNPTFGYSDDGAQTAATTVAITAGDKARIQYVSGSTTTDGNLLFTADANGYCCLVGPGFNAPGHRRPRTGRRRSCRKRR